LECSQTLLRIHGYEWFHVHDVWVRGTEVFNETFNVRFGLRQLTGTGYGLLDRRALDLGLDHRGYGLGESSLGFFYFTLP
jgi:hypothetical protein